VRASEGETENSDLKREKPVRANKRAEELRDYLPRSETKNSRIALEAKEAQKYASKNE